MKLQQVGLNEKETGLNLFKILYIYISISLMNSIYLSNNS